MDTLKINQVGLDAEKSAEIAQQLDGLLSTFQVFYQNARGFHWNIKGEKFFELHLKFEELYTDALLKIDEIAERILTLGYTPSHTFAEYLDKSAINVSKNVADGNEAVQHVVEGFQKLLKKERAILAFSDELNDEGTNALMGDYIRAQEKLVWMYSAFLNLKRTQRNN